MSRYSEQPLSFESLKTVSLTERGGKVTVEHFARPYAKGAGVSGHQTTSVAWGHAFSRLATGIEISAQNDNSHRFQSLAYRATVKCTDSQDDAWVVFG